ncbi:TolC family protein [Desulfofustis glycolicus]|nr:TolC family protein [Desulfofustis glycolicus]
MIRWFVYPGVVLAAGMLWVVSTLTCAAAAETDAIGLGLASAWQQVLAENDGLQAMQEEVREAEFRRDAAADLYWLEIGLSVDYLYADSDVTLSPSQLLGSMAGGSQLVPYVSSIAAASGMTVAQLDRALTSRIADRQQISSSIRGFWPLYTGGRIEAAQEAALGRVNEADKRLKNGERERFETLVRHYFGVVLASTVLTTRHETEEGLRRHREHALLLEQHGQIPHVERMQSEAALDKAVVERKKALRDLEIAEAALSKMLKNDGAVSPEDALFLNDTLPPMQEFLDLAVNNHPGILLLAAKREQAQAAEKAEKGRYHPTIGMFGSYQVYEQDDLAADLLPDWLVGIGLQVPLVERSGRSGLLNAARSAIRRIDLLTAQMKSDLSVLVERSYRQAEQAAEEYRGLRSSLALAEETVALRSKSFNQGMSTSLDVVDAELFLAGVKTQRALALYQYVTALAGLCGTTGTPERFFYYQKTQSNEVR